MPHIVVFGCEPVAGVVVRHLIQKGDGVFDKGFVGEEMAAPVYLMRY